jgi:signal transduction histidine kinase
VIALSLGERTLGVVVLADGASAADRRVAPDPALALELAARAALVLENARLFDRARKAIRARDDLLAMVSHDLRNPLGTILLNASLLERIVASEGGPAQKHLAVIHRSAERMNHLVASLLEAETISSGRLLLSRAPRGAAALALEAVELMSALANERGVRLVARGEAGAVVCDRERTLQVLGNLVGNAVRHAPAGSDVEVIVEARGDEVRFTVADRGPGVAPELLPRLFERGITGRRGGKGHGLGLFIARGIVEAHGGRMEVKSTPGQGARFSFTLPAAR